MNNNNKDNTLSLQKENKWQYQSYETGHRELRQKVDL